jgi:hypothetical protein
MDQTQAKRTIFRLPATKASPRDRLRLPPSTTSSDFVSQQLVGRQIVPEDDPRVIAEEALSAYERGARIAVRRMPVGYRKTIVA